MTMLTASYTEQRAAADAKIEDLLREYRVVLEDKSLSRHERRDTAFAIEILQRRVAA
jgi:hypothetical protein